MVVVAAFETGSWDFQPAPSDFQEPQAHLGAARRVVTVFLFRAEVDRLELADSAS